MCSGKNSRPPSPKVNASGGVPVKTSSGLRPQDVRGKQSQTAITSRWKCIVALRLAGGARGERDQRDVVGRGATLVERGGCLPRQRFEAVGRVVVPEARRARSVGQRGRVARQLVGQARVAERVRSPRLVDDLGQLLGAQQRHRRDATPPAFITANQQAAIIGLLAPRSSTRLPGTSPISRPARGRCRLACVTARRRSTAVGRAQRGGRRGRASPAVEQLGGGVEPRRDTAAPAGRTGTRATLARRQVVAREGVDVGGIARHFSSSRAMTSCWTSVAPS